MCWAHASAFGREGVVLLVEPASTAVGSCVLRRFVRLEERSAPRGNAVAAAMRAPTVLLRRRARATARTAWQCSTVERRSSVPSRCRAPVRSVAVTGTHTRDGARHQAVSGLVVGTCEHSDRTRRRTASWPACSCRQADRSSSRSATATGLSTAAMPEVVEPRGVAAVQVVVGVEPVEHDDRLVAERLERRHREAHRVDRAEPGVGDEHDLARRRRRDEVDGVTVAADRRSWAADRLEPRHVDLRIGPAHLVEELGQRGHGSARARRRPSVAPSGPRRCGPAGTPRRPAPRSRRPSTSASRGWSSSGSNDCAGLRAATGAPRARRSRARRRPTRSCPPPCAVPATTDRRSITASSDVGAAAFDEALDLLVGVGGRQRHAEAAGAGRDGRRADGGDEQALLEEPAPTRPGRRPRRRAPPG